MIVNIAKYTFLQFLSLGLALGKLNRIHEVLKTYASTHSRGSNAKIATKYYEDVDKLCKSLEN